METGPHSLRDPLQLSSPSARLLSRLDSAVP